MPKKSQMIQAFECKLVKLWLLLEKRKDHTVKAHCQLLLVCIVSQARKDCSIACEIVY